jgi:hypothetical protein
VQELNSAKLLVQSQPKEAPHGQYVLRWLFATKSCRSSRAFSANWLFEEPKAAPAFMPV